MFGSACLVMAQIQFFLIKKVKIGRPERSLTPTPSLHPITSHFCFIPPPSPPQSGLHMSITPESNVRFFQRSRFPLQIIPLDDDLK